MESKYSPRRCRATARQLAALKLRSLGRTYAQVGEALGVTHQAAYRLVALAYRAARRESVAIAERLLMDDLASLRQMLDDLTPQALGGDVAAMDRVLVLHARRDRLTGRSSGEDQPDGDDSRFPTQADCIALRRHAQTGDVPHVADEGDEPPAALAPA
jgi:hypothetical protein